eukprot:1408417-Rhodomonas_salina.1
MHASEGCRPRPRVPEARKLPQSPLPVSLVEHPLAQRRDAGVRAEVCFVVFVEQDHPHALTQLQRAERCGLRVGVEEHAALEPAVRARGHGAERSQDVRGVDEAQALDGEHADRALEVDVGRYHREPLARDRPVRRRRPRRRGLLLRLQIRKALGHDAHRLQGRGDARRFAPTVAALKSRARLFEALRRVPHQRVALAAEGARPVQLPPPVELQPFVPDVSQLPLHHQRAPDVVAEPDDQR